MHFVKLCEKSFGLEGQCLSLPAPRQFLPTPILRLLAPSPTRGCTIHASVQIQHWSPPHPHAGVPFTRVFKFSIGRPLTHTRVYHSRECSNSALVAPSPTRGCTIHASVQIQHWSPPHPHAGVPLTRVFKFSTRQTFPRLSCQIGQTWKKKLTTGSFEERTCYKES